MGRTAKPRKPYRRRIERVPVMPELIKEFEEQLRISLACLRTSPSIESFDAVAEILNVIALTLESLKRPKLHASYKIITSGSSAMMQIEGKRERTGKVHMSDIEYLPILNAVNEALTVLPRLDVMSIYCALQKLRAPMSTQLT